MNNLLKKPAAFDHRNCASMTRTNAKHKRVRKW